MRRRALLCGLVLPLVFLPFSAVRASDESSSNPAWLGVLLGREVSIEGGGVPLGRIVVDSPADKAGLRARDVVQTVDGKPVSSRQELIKSIQLHEPGSWIPLSISRDGNERELRVRLAERPEQNPAYRLREGWIGVDAIDLPAALREHFGAPPNAGVMISKVEAGSPAEAAGFELGDVLFEVDGKRIASRSELHSRVAAGGVGNEREFTLFRNGAEIILEARLENAPDRPRGQ